MPKQNKTQFKAKANILISPLLLLSTITMLFLFRAEYREAAVCLRGDGGPSKSICDPAIESDKFLGAADVLEPQ